ncbi:hypothetical protein EYC84_010412 [Monilinia fructicola]|uniref:Uncharacterized protein n=1 Tax=Monilinia fructicola TaxID=38448 RepID=A0A5M9JGF0_MONFR|nr:hypothetical protein EYC84_010412 [Monilinia fructicola]
MQLRGSSSCKELVTEAGAITVRSAEYKEQRIKAEDRGQRTEDNGQRTKDKVQYYVNIPGCSKVTLLLVVQVVHGY